MFCFGLRPQTAGDGRPAIERVQLMCQTEPPADTMPQPIDRKYLTELTQNTSPAHRLGNAAPSGIPKKVDPIFG